MSDPRFVELLDAYWNAAYTQGEKGRTHDDRRGSAQIAESNLCHYVDSLRSALSTARAEGRREGLEEAATYCERTVMASPYGGTKPIYSRYVPDPYTEEDAKTLGAHHGLGYAAAIRAKIEETRALAEHEEAGR